MVTELAERTLQGKLRFSPHPGQWKAWNSQKRFIAVIAGTQSGKTSFGPHWLYREIQMRGPGDYMVVTPTFALLEKKALPEFKRLFSQWLKLGAYVSSPVRKFTFSEEGAKRTFGQYDPDRPTVIFFGYAEDPESLESSTAKAAWCDEAGQKKFKLASWEALLRRLSLSQGRVLISTTPYDLGWLKQQVYDRWKRVGTDLEMPGDRDFDVIRFDSTENPLFPQEEFERARQTLPRWKFDLFYRGIFTRPAGQIYDSFIDEYEPGHKCKRFTIPAGWQRYLGLDFGNVNTAACFYAKHPASGKLYLYRTYHTGGRSAEGHVESLLRNEPGLPICAGGSRSEDDWRLKYKDAGLSIREPVVAEVEAGISIVYGAHRTNQIIVFDDLSEYLEQKATYSREVDASGEPTDKIEDKNTFHLMDAERYIIPIATGYRPPVPGKAPSVNPMGVPLTWKSQLGSR